MRLDFFRVYVNPKGVKVVLTNHEPSFWSENDVICGHECTSIGVYIGLRMGSLREKPQNDVFFYCTAAASEFLRISRTSIGWDSHDDAVKDDAREDG